MRKLNNEFASQQYRRLLTVLIVIIILFALFIFNSHSNKTVMSGVILNEETVEEENVNVPYISIPGFTSLDFVANSYNQEVSFYNPQSNNCYMDIQIIIDGEVYWSCEKLYPGYGFNEIELSHKMNKGNYDAIYKVRCFDIETNEEMNGCTVNFEIYVN